MKAKGEQSIFDIVAQEFGTLEEMFTLLNVNSLTLNTKLVADQELTINKTNKGDENVKDFVSLRNISLNNNQGVSVPPLPDGDYNIDFNIDFL